MSVRTVLVCEPQVPFVTGGIGAAIATLAGDRRQATLGAAGREIAGRITWDGVVEKLVEA